MENIKDLLIINGDEFSDKNHSSILEMIRQRNNL
jgi:hypothetical protein